LSEIIEISSLFNTQLWLWNQSHNLPKQEIRQKMYNINNTNDEYLSNREYHKSVKHSLETSTAHLGNYSGGYQLKPSKINTDYNLFK
jgi:hypothetical protein